MKNEYLIAHLKCYNQAHDWGISDKDLAETLTEGKVVYRGEPERHRWWNIVFHVVNIAGVNIGFDYCEATGDDSPSDLGWEFDWNSVCECEPVQVIKTIYVPKSQ